MTFKDIDYYLYCINRREAQEKKFQASLSGRKIKNLVIPKRRNIDKTKKAVENLGDKINESKIEAAFKEKFEKWQKR